MFSRFCLRTALQLRSDTNITKCRIQAEMDVFVKCLLTNVITPSLRPSPLCSTGIIQQSFLLPSLVDKLLFQIT